MQVERPSVVAGISNYFRNALTLALIEKYFTVQDEQLTPRREVFASVGLTIVNPLPSIASSFLV